MNKKLKLILYGVGGFLALMIFIVVVAVSTPKQEPVVASDQIQQAVPKSTSTVASTTTRSVSPIQVSKNNGYTYYKVTEVVDGDTIKININGKIETLRLIGLDTPETVDPRKPVQCFGKEASNKAKELLIGKNVRIEKDISQGELDKYNRLLVYIYREDGLFYNKHMIETGYAHEYTYNTPYKYQTEFKAAQKTAQQNSLGLWSPNTCSGNTTSIQSPSPELEKVQQPVTTSAVTKYYTSSYSTSKYYYPESCEGWKSLNAKYLTAFDSLQALLNAFPTRAMSPQC